MRKRVILALCALVMALAMLPVRALAEESKAYVALGDSITSGYGLEDAEAESFPALVAERGGFELINLASDEGVTSATVLSQLRNPDVLAKVQDADLITLTVGGNDVLGALYAFLAERYAVVNPGAALTPEQIIEALAAEEPNLELVASLMQLVPEFAASPQAAQALADFGTNLTGIVATVSAANPDASFVVVNQYNPYGRFDSPLTSDLVLAFDKGVAGLNSVIAMGASSGAYVVADAGTVLGSAEENPFNASFFSLADFNLDFHPNAYGHQLIAGSIAEVLGLAEPEPTPDPEPTPEPGLGFTDVSESDWYYDVVQWAVAAGVMSGYGDGETFGALNPISRAEMAVVLWRAAGKPSSEAALPADCDASAFYADAVSWALGAGVFTGYDEDTFGPLNTLTREQAATVLWRVSGAADVDADLTAFPDAGAVTEFAAPAMRWAVASGIITGSEGRLVPQGSCSRVELVAMLMRATVG